MLSANESHVEIDPAIPEISQNEQADRQNFKQNACYRFICIYWKAVNIKLQTDTVILFIGIVGLITETIAKGNLTLTVHN